MPVRVSRNHHIGFLDVAVHALVVVEIQDACLSCSKIERDRTSTSCLAQIKPVIRGPHNSKMMQKVSKCTTAGQRCTDLPKDPGQPVLIQGHSILTGPLRTSREIPAKVGLTHHVNVGMVLGRSSLQPSPTYDRCTVGPFL